MHHIFKPLTFYSSKFKYFKTREFNDLSTSDKMVLKLKYHEAKLLKKVDCINWEVDNNLHEVKVMKRYCIQKREDYTMYNKLSREIREIVRRIKDLVRFILIGNNLTCFRAINTQCLLCYASGF